MHHPCWEVGDSFWINTEAVGFMALDLLEVAVLVAFRFVLPQQGSCWTGSQHPATQGLLWTEKKTQTIDYDNFVITKHVTYVMEVKLILTNAPYMYETNRIVDVWVMVTKQFANWQPLLYSVTIIKYWDSLGFFLPKNTIEKKNSKIGPPDSEQSTGCMKTVTVSGNIHLPSPPGLGL